MAQTEEKRLQHNVELHSLVQKQIDVPENEIHYKQERYDRYRKQERSDVVPKYVTFQNQRDAPLSR